MNEIPKLEVDQTSETPGHRRDKILLVEDMKFFATIVSQRLEADLGLQVVSVATLGQAREVLAAEGEEFFLALLDLVLPDAPDGEIVDLVAAAGVPSIIFSSRYSDEVRTIALDKGAIDFVVKDSPSSLQYLIDTVRRVQNNRRLTALVVDDSATTRRYIRNILESQMLNVIEAEDGQAGLEALQAADVAIAITDYNMPRMDGFEFIRNARNSWPKDSLAIIGISASDDGAVSSKLLKSGANDFINKPFSGEEFVCRLSQNLDLLEKMAALREAATKDPLTGLHNRRYFHETARPLFASAVRGQIDLTPAMVDIDFFKRVNDSHGHDAGDLVLRAVADELGAQARGTDIVARFGGEEFCLLFVNMLPSQLASHLEKLRARIEALDIVADGKTINVTASIGVSAKLEGSLDAMISDADRMLYHAKESGRNRVSGLNEADRTGELADTA